MSLIKYRFKNIEELKKHILSDIPTFYFSSATSTVIPYDKLEELYKEKDFHSFVGQVIGISNNVKSYI